MRKLGVWGLAASLAVGLASQEVRADDGEKEKPSSSWSIWPWKWGKGDAPAEKKADADAAAKKAAEDGKAREERLLQQEYRAREDYLRRQAVCDRLKELATQLQDARLERKAEELFERAWEVYRKRSAQLKAQGTAAADEPKPEPKVPRTVKELIELGGEDEPAPERRKEGKP